MTLQHTLQRGRAAVRYGREHGLVALARLVRHRVRHTGAPFAKIDVIGFYSFVRGEPFGKPWCDGEVARNTVNWVVPPFGRGSGGHLNIFRFVKHLEDEGFQCRVIVSGEPRPQSPERCAEQIRDWFFPLKASVHLGMENAPSAHVTIATGWQTAYAVRDFRSTKHRCYFVQDFEPAFYPLGSEYAFAEETYRFDFIGITAGNWLAQRLAADYGMVTHAVGFSYDRERYRPLHRREPETRRVFFYARPPTARRAFELGLLVLDEVTRRLPDVKVILAGWDVSGYEIPFEHLNCGILDLDELPDLYSQCDVGLVLSFSNLSLLPLELMACGVPVVSNRAPCTEWLLNDHNARLASPTVEALADAVCEVFEDRALAARLRTAGLATASCTDWRAEAARMGEVLRNLDATEDLLEVGT